MRRSWASGTLQSSRWVEEGRRGGLRGVRGGEEELGIGDIAEFEVGLGGRRGGADDCDGNVDVISRGRYSLDLSPLGCELNNLWGGDVFELMSQSIWSMTLCPSPPSLPSPSMPPLAPPPPQARLASEHEALEAANVVSVLGSAPMVDSVVFQMRKLGGMLGEIGGRE